MTTPSSRIPRAPIVLRRAALGALPPNVAAPGYDPASLRAGIVHVGVGNFHRAHQAVYLDELFARGRGRAYGIIGAGVREGDRAMRAALAQQDWLTTVVEQDGEEARPRVTASMVGFVDPADVRALVGTMAEPATRIVSLTVTEGGYCVDAATGRFDGAHPDIVADAAAYAALARDPGAAPAAPSARDAHAPRTGFAPIVAALARRRAEGRGPFTVMSCDNLPGNGDATRAAMVGLAARIDDALAHWIEEHASFPNAMVDRITPATTDEQRTALRARFGIDDARPVFCEAFRQWVLEDRFCAGRPPLEDVGVTFVDDVHPYERMKIRILNGGHAAIAYVSALLDIVFVHEAMADPRIGRFLSRLLTEEVIPVVPPVPGVDLLDYKASVERRFANRAVRDTIRRLCLDGSNRQPKFIVPTIRARLERGQSVAGLALVSAAWCRYCAGTTDSGAVIEPNDDAWPRLAAAARASALDPRAWLSMHDIYGTVGEHPAFIAAFGAALRTLAREGTARALAAYAG
ncbi:MAG TPA: mannitol dehydrogenase family protein [Casimicrobiaceae bacterium]|nr:mannitol dehydrogenase family protein [Casimicrobiaceae bacterium]